MKQGNAIRRSLGGFSKSYDDRHCPQALDHPSRRQDCGDGFGRIVAEGTREDLIAGKGLYHRLWNVQTGERAHGFSQGDCCISRVYGVEKTLNPLQA